MCREAQVTLDEFEESDERIRARTKEANPPRPNHQNKQAHLESPGKLQCQWHSASGVRHDACHIGHRAFESCKLLTLVDISGKKSTPCICTRSHNATAWKQSNCHPACVRSEQKSSLAAKPCPGSIRYIGCGAFSNCVELSHLGYARNKSEAWRYPCAANNAFEECVKPATPKWLHTSHQRTAIGLPPAIGLQTDLNHLHQSKQQPLGVCIARESKDGK